MKVSKEIANKVRQFQLLQNQTNELYKEIKEFFEDEFDSQGFGEPFITNKPSGTLQNGDEYCHQVTLGEDWYQGKYYHQIEDSDQYVGYYFDI